MSNRDATVAPSYNAVWVILWWNCPIDRYGDKVVWKSAYCNLESAVREVSREFGAVPISSLEGDSPLTDIFTVRYQTVRTAQYPPHPLYVRFLKVEVKP